MSLPPGLIGVPCGEQGRYSDFLPSIVQLQRPPGTDFIKTTSLGPAQGLNTIGRAFMDNPKYQWLFLTNDDNLCPVDTIPRLLSHKFADVVSGLYFGRIQPFEPILFDSIEIKDGKKWYNRHLMQPGEKGLIPAEAVGDGCLLIHRWVMERLAERYGLWWEYGETLSDACDHDIVFSRKVRESGFGVWCDLDLKVDHIAQFAVRPYRNGDGTWEVHLVQGADERTIALPAAFGERVKGRNE